MLYVVSLDSKDLDIKIVGGKAHSLSRMINAGFMVPPGFVITDEALTAGLEYIADEVLTAFNKLGVQRVAVRSSAVAEDGNTASWAGQLETFLDVQQDSLMECIAKCCSSSQSIRAQAYASHHGMESGSVAVVVQAMVRSSISGVAFSVHPITKRHDQVVIEAGLGLGEAIVSGAITPDTYVVAKQANEIFEKHISKQSKQLIQDNQWVEVSSEGAEQKLPDSMIFELRAIVKKLEAFWGCPVDIEWAVEDNTLYITQCRPITTL